MLELETRRWQPCLTRFIIYLLGHFLAVSYYTFIQNMFITYTLRFSEPFSDLTERVNLTFTALCDLVFVEVPHHASSSQFNSLKQAAHSTKDTVNPLTETTMPWALIVGPRGRG